MPVTIRPSRPRPFAPPQVIATRPADQSAAGLIAIAFAVMVVISCAYIAINGAN